MTNENALFDDEFDFDDEPKRSGDLVGQLTGARGEEDAEAGSRVELPPMEAYEGGDRAIPAISVLAFCETRRVSSIIDRVQSDRRMSNATVEIIPGGIPAAIEHLAEHPTPNLLIVESSAPASQMIAQIDELAGHCEEGVEVMVVGATNDIALYRQLVARGVSEYLVPPIEPVQMVRSIANIFTDPDAPFVGKSISVVGAKGGVGASTIAHNLAWSLAENARVSTSLVDLDLSFGTTSLDFNHETQQTIADALMAPDRADDAVISRLLAKATDRLSLFTAPASVNQLMDIDASAYSTVIEGVRRLMPYVVLDLPHGWSQWIYNTLISSDEVILVCQPDLASLRNGKNMLDKLKTQRPNDRPPRLVINMMGVPKRPEIPIKDFAAAIEAEPEIVLPFDPHLFGTASNKGQMISEADPQSKPAVAIDQLATTLSGRETMQPEKSLLKKLLGK
ncbi:MAG: pilus assembly protein CpaE [Hyphomonadaceae bacterium]|jgi:pilus assembly protein CpaE|uniref:AAA family ATPase n=1 Tax=Henriciella sp. TaxID=1968823 RepID=UPI000C11991A|nr:AAA family ATPase [Henriciella sp.]MBF34826.1 pilus assembly protein CpaE [Hyphomonadaceae bacterium]PHR76794.1 MAG: pilus assembly protein CpaE [Henriciella sp.]|tara:strand:- start:958 stop:2307 length:1350 start_codon:yes stop_codon:yes gene_type:complete